MTAEPSEAADRALIDGLLARRPRDLARAITLAESTRDDHRERARRILDAVLPRTGRSLRIGVSGPPGSGKSTFIEALGLHLVGLGRRPAVLAVDPSSAVTGGSILGDKTRMERLGREADAFIRPSPTKGSLGGVAESTRETILLCEAAGFDAILVETVGVGQSEAAVAGMVDAVALLQLPNAGDDLQALKRGIVEHADLVLINKADLDHDAAEAARAQVAGAVGLLRPPSLPWTPPVLAISAKTGEGIGDCWAEIEKFHRVMMGRGEFDARRRRQAIDWMWALIDAGLRERFRRHPRVCNDLEATRNAVAEGATTPEAAARRLLGHLDA